MLSTYRQTGISLISSMIGLLISMVALLGMMSLYGTVVKSTVESTRDARIAGERSSALLVATRELQGAGYGIIGGATLDTDLWLLSGDTLALDEASGAAFALEGASGSLRGGNTLFWKTRPNQDVSTVWCSGLHAPDSDDQGGLYLLQPQHCSALTPETVWQVRPLLIDNSDAVDNYLPVTIALLIDRDCQALGIAGAGKTSVKLSTFDRNGNSIISSTCLLNFASEGPPQ